MLLDGPIKNVPGDLPRKWLSDQASELIIWYSQNNQIFGFQFCYDLHDLPKALTYTPDKGFSHHFVDSGEHDPAVNETPVLSDSCKLDLLMIESIFRDHSSGLPDGIRDFVFGHLSELGKRGEQDAAANP